MILLRNQLGLRVRRTCSGDDYVLVEIALAPPLILGSWHAPSTTAGHEVFLDSLAKIQADYEYLVGPANPHGARLVLCGDFNTQLNTFDSVIGDYVGTGERQEDVPRATAVLGLAQTLALKVFSTFSDIGPTRSPWPSAKRRGAEDSIIDFTCASDQLIGRVAKPELFPRSTASDHCPLWIRLLAPKRDRRCRKRLMEGVLKSFGPNHLPSAWEPDDKRAFDKSLAEVVPESLEHLASSAVNIAKQHTKPSYKADPERHMLLQGLRNAPDPITRKAYQIRLRKHGQDMKRQREAEQLQKWCTGKSWTLPPLTKCRGP